MSEAPSGRHKNVIQSNAAIVLDTYVTSADSQVLKKAETTSQSQAPSNG
jgi:hypothetical protein